MEQKITRDGFIDPSLYEHNSYLVVSDGETFIWRYFNYDSHHLPKFRFINVLGSKSMRKNCIIDSFQMPYHGLGVENRTADET